jgi:hypothetical protein
MALYHFNLVGGRPERDVDGTECPTVAHARRAAVHHAGMLLITQPDRFWDGHAWTLEAVRAEGGAVFSLRFQAERIVPDEWLD